MIAVIDFWAKRLVAYPLVMGGWALTQLAGWMIQCGAWIADVETE